MKKIFLILLIFTGIANLNAQVNTNFPTSPLITNSNVMLDGSSFSEAGPYVGKGIIIPSVDLVNFQFDLTLADGFTFPTYFDGMLVYNNATGTTLTTGNRSSTATAVTPGFYYFFNPNGATNGNVTAGVWKSLDGDGSGTGTNPDGTVDMLIGSNTYKTFDYGGAIWMVENSMEGTPSSTLYPNTGTEPNTTGVVNGYYYTQDQAAGACPSGWHLPDQAEFDALTTWVNANMSSEGAKFWVTDAEFPFSGYRIGSTWRNWSFRSHWWGAGTSGQHFFATTSGMVSTTTASTTSLFTVRCVKN